MDMQAAIKELQEAAIVMSSIQARQTSLIKGHSEWLTEHDKAMLRHEAIMERVELGLAEATEKLNALINIVDSQRRGE